MGLVVLKIDLQNTLTFLLLIVAAWYPALCNFQNEVTEGITDSWGWMACSGGSQPPCCEDIQVTLWKGLFGEKLRPGYPSFSPHNTVDSYVNELSWKPTLQPQWILHVTRAPANTLTATIRKPCQDHSDKLFLDSQLCEKWHDMINIYCFKLWNLGVTCYTVIDNECSAGGCPC